LITLNVCPQPHALEPLLFSSFPTVTTAISMRGSEHEGGEGGEEECACALRVM
jgi:hypothetical protein